MREDLVLHNFASEPAGVSLRLELGADFEDLFAVKAGRTGEAPPVEVRAGAEEWHAAVGHGTSDRSVTVRAPGATVSADALGYRVVVAPHDTWCTSLEVTIQVAGEAIPPRFTLGGSVESAGPVVQFAEWRERTPVVESTSLELAATIARSNEDIAALRLTDPAEPTMSVVAAGAPWFMALFGRDSLLASSMMLAMNPDLAVGTLRALARHQGKVTEPLSEEQPGRILHELRFGTDISLAPGAAERYYGSADATPLFVIVLGQLARWGADPKIVDELLPAADRALEWVQRYGDRDGDGYVEYLRATDKGLRNQGWKDSVDGVTYADGALAQPPIALVEVQAYVYAAFRARAQLAATSRDHDAAKHWDHEADELRRRLNHDFWLPGGYFAMGLDAEKRPIDALTSNIGHVLWAGAADPDKAALVAERLLSPEMFSGYGIRTLATTMGAYNAASYHNGSVWPHDTALCVAGLVRYGFSEHARRVAAGLIEASAFFAGRLPELFCGFAKGTLPGPVPYPASCSPQAWASTAPVLILTAMLGLDPDVPSDSLSVSPALPPEWGAVSVRDISVGPHRVTIEVADDGTWSVTGAGSLALTEPRGVEPPEPTTTTSAS